MDLTTLIAQCRKGDALAWEMLVRRFQARVYGLAYHYAGNAEEARDLAQEVFVRIYRRLETCTDAETFVPWMIRLARNVCIDRLRRMRTRPQTIATPVEELTHLVASGQDPGRAYEAGSRKRVLHQALAKLSGVNREIILLKDIQGLGLPEIARMLGIPVGTAKSRSHRARLELAQEVRALVGSEAEGLGD